MRSRPHVEANRPRGPKKTPKRDLWTNHRPVDGGFDTPPMPAPITTKPNAIRMLDHRGQDRGVLRPRQDDHREIEHAGFRQALLSERPDQPADRPAQRVRSVRL